MMREPYDDDALERIRTVNEKTIPATVIIEDAMLLRSSNATSRDVVTQGRYRRIQEEAQRSISGKINAMTTEKEITMVGKNQNDARK